MDRAEIQEALLIDGARVEPETEDFTDVVVEEPKAFVIETDI